MASNTEIFKFDRFHCVVDFLGLTIDLTMKKLTILIMQMTQTLNQSVLDHPIRDFLLTRSSI